jgi:C4-dicarboxylate transporter DctM subunit
VLLTAVVAALLLFMHIPLSVLHQTLFGAVNAYTLLAVPFFIFTGELMGRGSVAQRLVNFVNAGVGRIPGGFGVTTVCSSALFGAMSGLSAASVATIGRAMLPALTKAGYPMRFSAGLLTSMGAIDVVIPPSIPLLGLWHGGAGIRAAALRRRHRPGAAADLSAVRLCRLVLLAQRHRRRARVRLAPSWAGRRPCAASPRWAHRSSSSAASMAACSRPPKRPPSPASMPRACRC